MAPCSLLSGTSPSQIPAGECDFLSRIRFIPYWKEISRPSVKLEALLGFWSRCQFWKNQD
jgi:hypothetical protein